MKTVYLLQNQHKHLLSKGGEWVDGRDANLLYRSVHRDEALNQMIETNARDYTLRIRILEAQVNDRGRPLLKDEDLPPLGELSTGAVPSTEQDNSISAEPTADESPIVSDEGQSAEVDAGASVTEPL
ncbi:hypothetical protein HBA55_24525 [Pseudomaricurvus alkylphenolicus]|jgi:hypothetical protein|uniref:hypothetical protein n=1 Tax=Pseudomaricurvus alkylphenolicus TaxID=1306991 RepID=UPI0014245836|nr:hypothetical protein [Pseudomaricurvus alkylphenolicus]NIB42795.1 hypothetical protein [Pseudomaricurvus alkylphenolicus]